MIKDTMNKEKQLKILTKDFSPLEINPVNLVYNLFQTLNEREKDVLLRRFGLVSDKKQTLEEIGKGYKITRERVRQIENDSIRKLRALSTDKVKELESLITRLLQRYNGIMEEEHLLDTLLDFLTFREDQKDLSKRSLNFMISRLIDSVDRVKSDDELHDILTVKPSSLESVQALLNELVENLANKNKPLDTKELFSLIREKDLYKLDTREGAELDDLIFAHLNLSKRVKQNILGQWGLTDWTVIKPKRINNKVYLIMKKVGKPLHFNEIAELITQAKFDKKVACPATVHNELILDNKFVLVGRGIYALKEWGYKSGTVGEIIENILKKTGPLSKEEIIEKVLGQRLVKKPTIYLALMDKNKFERSSSGEYKLVA